MNVGIRRCLSYNPDKYMPWHRLDVEVKKTTDDLKSYHGIATRAHAHSGGRTWQRAASSEDALRVM